jgi:L-ascorbate metabolism protein UlaG (beta-lactamase superfamily)
MAHDELRLTLIGGPTLLIEWSGLRLLTDPTFDRPVRCTSTGRSYSGKPSAGASAGLGRRVTWLQPGRTTVVQPYRVASR